MTATKREHLFKRAFQANREKNYDLACERWQSYLDTYPNDASARANYVASLLSTVELEEALQQAREGLEKTPLFQGAREVFLNALEANDLIDEMEQEAERQCREWPLDSVPWEAKGRAALYRENNARAEQYFREAARLNPWSNFAWAHIALFSFSSGRFEEALNAFGQTFATASDAPVPPEIVKHDALVNQAMCLLYMERPHGALVLSEQAEALNVDVGQTRMIQARAKFSLGHSDAATIAEGAIRLGAKTGYLMMALANYYAESGDLRRAREILDSEQPGSDSYALNIRGVALARVGRHQEAIQSLEDLKGSLPEFVRLNSLAVANMIADDPGEALSNVVEALKHKEDHVILTNAGILCLQLGDRASSDERIKQSLAYAERYLRRALELEPNAPSAMYNLGFCYFLQGKEITARSQLRKLAESTKFDSNLKAAAKELLGRIEQGQEIADRMKTEDLAIISRGAAEEARQLLNHYKSRRFEDECCRWAAMSGGPLSWDDVESHKILKHGGQQKEIDVYGMSLEPSGEVVHLGECKLRIQKSNPVSEAELEELVSKMKFVQGLESMSTRRVRGSFFANADYSAEALVLARHHEIRVCKARLKKNWQNSPEWTVTGLEEINTGSEIPNAES